MEWTYLLVDFTEEGISKEDLSHDQLTQGFAMTLNVVDDVDEAIMSLSSGAVGAMSVFTDDWTNDVQSVFKAFHTRVGSLPDLQTVICDDPSPNFLIKAYEFGVESFIAIESWQSEVNELAKTASDVLADKNSTEFKSLKITSMIRKGDQEDIKKASEEIAELAEYDFRAAYARGRAYEAVGEFNTALGQYQQAQELNKKFRPISNSLGETHLILGQYDEAVAIFEKLERSNPYDVDRKIHLASAYLEKKDLKKAKEFIKAASELSPNHPRVTEAKAQVMLATGKVGEAFKLMDQLEDVGPYFASKLNEMGVRLSQAGKGKSALALYKKAHKIVRPELKYKISLNSALACRRMKNYELALKYVARCKKEFGGSFEKIAKIEAVLLKAMAQLKKKAS